MKKDMINFVKKIIVLMLTVGIIFCGIMGWAVSLPTIFSQSYTAALCDKYNRLCEIETPKIILIAGSNFAFGIDSQYMEKELKMPVVNMGLQASWGMQTTLDISKANIGEGDIIILGYEYFLYNQPDANYELVVNTIENNLELYGRIIRKENIIPITAKFIQYIATNFEDKIHGKEHSYVAPYSRDSFNEYGDNIYERPELIATEIAYDSLFVDETRLSDEAVSILNDYYKCAKKQGAEVYITFASTNEEILMDESDLDAFQKELEAKVDIPVISDANSYIYPCSYFFDGDGNHHLNDGAIRLRTAQLVEDIKAAILIRNGLQ